MYLVLIFLVVVLYLVKLVSMGVEAMPEFDLLFFRRSLLRGIDAYCFAQSLVSSESSTTSEWIVGRAAVAGLDADLRRYLEELGGMAGEW